MRPVRQAVEVVATDSDAPEPRVLAVVDVTDSNATAFNRVIVAEAASVAAKQGKQLSVLALAANDAPLRERVDALSRWYTTTRVGADPRWMPRFGSVESVLPEAAMRYGADVVVADSACARVARGGPASLFARAS